MDPVKRITSVNAGRNGAAIVGISIFVLAVGLCLLAPCPARAQTLPCPPPLDIQLGEFCVPVGYAFEPLDMAARLDQEDPNHPDITAWEVLPYWGDVQLEFSLDNFVLNADYPPGFVGCREAKVEARTDDGCTYARFWLRYSVAPTPVVALIPDQFSDPFDPNCPDVMRATLNLDDYLSGIVDPRLDPNDPNGVFDPSMVTWTYDPNTPLVVDINSNTHEATITNNTGADVTATVTFTVCLVPDAGQQPKCEPCPEYCKECASVVVTFVMTCRDVERLVLTKDDGLDYDECVDPNGLITYEICFDNPNDFTVYQVSLVDTLPFNASFVSASDVYNHDPNAGTVTWEFDLLDPNDGQCVELVVQVSPDASGSVVHNSVAITGIRPAVAGNTDAVNPLSNFAETFTDVCFDLNLTKNDGLVEEDGCVVANGQITYEICFDNICGKRTTVNDVPSCWVTPGTLVDILPDEVAFVSASDDGVYDPNSHTVTWNFEPTETDNDRTCVQVVVQLGPDALPGSTLTNVARLGLIDAQGTWEVAIDTNVCPPPVPDPCPTCPDSIETRAVGFFCPSAATIMLALVTAGIITARRRRA
ncbi:MAG TPA: hypothetical protein VMZ31_04260 [Phycisphaerae bacterium]|nr:hypothetical protein [Phycisphaerae bacterium]